MEEIKIVIGKGGKITLGVHGLKGSACSDLTKKLEKALGDVESSRKTDEYYENESTNSLKQGTGGEY